MGLAEGSDATVIVISEQDGAVRVARGAELKRLGNPSEFLQALGPARQSWTQRWIAAGRRLITSQIRLKVAAAGLTTILCIVSILEPPVKRILMIPVEFTNLPRTMEIADVSRRMVQVEMRGRTWVMDSIDASQLVAAVDLSGAQPGLGVIRVRPEILRVPPGIAVDRVLPSTLDVRIESVRRPASPYSHP
jgi:hypothetical protein